MPEPTAADCLAALDRVALKLDQALALLALQRVPVVAPGARGFSAPLRRQRQAPQMG